MGAGASGWNKHLILMEQFRFYVASKSSESNLCAEKLAKVIDLQLVAHVLTVDVNNNK